MASFLDVGPVLENFCMDENQYASSLPLRDCLLLLTANRSVKPFKFSTSKPVEFGMRFMHLGDEWFRTEGAKLFASLAKTTLKWFCLMQVGLTSAIPFVQPITVRGPCGHGNRIHCGIYLSENDIRVVYPGDLNGYIFIDNVYTYHTPLFNEYIHVYRPEWYDKLPMHIGERWDWRRMRRDPCVIHLQDDMTRFTVRGHLHWPMAVKKNQPSVLVDLAPRCADVVRPYMALYPVGPSASLRNCLQVPPPDILPQQNNSHIQKVANPSVVVLWVTDEACMYKYILSNRSRPGDRKSSSTDGGFQPNSSKENKTDTFEREVLRRDGECPIRTECCVFEGCVIKNFSRYPLSNVKQLIFVRSTIEDVRGCVRWMTKLRYEQLALHHLGFVDTAGLADCLLQQESPVAAISVR